MRAHKGIELGSKHHSFAGRTEREGISCGAASVAADGTTAAKRGLKPSPSEWEACL